MSLARTLASLIATVLIGALSIFTAIPRKTVKTKTRSTKATTHRPVVENDDLFI